VRDRPVLDLPWERLTEDYDRSRGSFLGLLFMAVSPLLAVKLRQGLRTAAARPNNSVDAARQ
jgi:hypothetical protein